MNKGIFSKNLNANTKYQYIYEAIVKDTVDGARQGRLKVWIPELCAIESDSTSWILANYASPFAGSSDISKIDNKIESFEGSQSSYGFWAVPPDVGNIVLVFFANGRSDRCYWFSCTYQQYMNQSVPAVTADQNNFKKKGTALPVTEYNKNNKGVNVSSVTRPYHKIKTDAIGKQGLLYDKIRGISSSSARRETTSKVFGWSSPGRLLPSGKRANGHSFVMDDDENNSNVTIETSLGTKIKLDDTNGLIYIINKDGKGWIEIDKEGNVMVFGSGSLSFRAKDKLNMYADNEVNIETKKLNIRSTSISTEAETADLKINTIVTESDNIDIKSQSKVIIDTGTISIKSGNANLTEQGKLSLANELFATDVKTNSYSLNTHEHLYNPGPGGPTLTSSKNSNPGSISNGSSAKSAIVKELLSKIDVLDSFNDDLYQDRSTTNIETIVETLVTYEPCPEHVK